MTVAFRALMMLPFGVAVALASPAFADDIHKCRASDGSTIYQDSGCEPGMELDAPLIDTRQPDVPPPVAVPTTPEAPIAEIEVDRTPPPRPPPPLFRCVRYDGQESTVTNNPVVKRYYVPAWAVVSEMESGGPGRANTKRQPAPNVLNAPPQVATGYVWVEDRCYRMSADDACAYWRMEASEADRLGRIAFDAERKQLEGREREYRSNFDQYCR